MQALLVLLLLMVHSRGAVCDGALSRRQLFPFLEGSIATLGVRVSGPLPIGDCKVVDEVECSPIIIAWSDIGRMVESTSLAESVPVTTHLQCVMLGRQRLQCS